MFKKVLHSLAHFFLVSVILIIIAAIVGISQHASVNFGNAPLAYKVGGEGPYVFFEEGQLAVHYIRGTREDGFNVQKTHYPTDQAVPAEAYFAGDNSTFSFSIEPLDKAIPPSEYDTTTPILAVSDLEGNYKAFRDFLIANQVVTKALSWNFGTGHLVLVGDMVDRGFSTTQLLWLIYKLEQEAIDAGGKVHYIIGNHEIKNLQANVRSAADKYIPIAGFFGKASSDLLGKTSFLGQWLARKNTIEKINGHLFVHGGLHPQMIDEALDLNTINTTVRKYYRQMFYPGIADPVTSLLISTETGPAWYRGYFHDEVEEHTFNDTLAFYDAKTVVVGHTLQFRVNSDYAGKLFAIDVKHPNDYRASFPVKSSEGLFIDGDAFFRVLANGEKIKL